MSLQHLELRWFVLNWANSAVRSFICKFQTSHHGTMVLVVSLRLAPGKKKTAASLDYFQSPWPHSDCPVKIMGICPSDPSLIMMHLCDWAGCIFPLTLKGRIHHFNLCDVITLTLSQHTFYILSSEFFFERSKAIHNMEIQTYRIFRYNNILRNATLDLRFLLYF